MQCRGRHKGPASPDVELLEVLSCSVTAAVLVPVLCVFVSSGEGLLLTLHYCVQVAHNLSENWPEVELA
jgi:hypothetical protein